MEWDRNMERLFNWVGIFWILSFAATALFRPLWPLLLMSSSLLAIIGITMVVGIEWYEARTQRREEESGDASSARNHPKRGLRIKFRNHQYGILLIFGGILFGAAALVESDIAAIIPTAMLVTEAAAVTGFIWIASVLILGRR